VGFVLVLETRATLDNEDEDNDDESKAVLVANALNLLRWTLEHPCGAPGRMQAGGPPAAMAVDCAPVPQRRQTVGAIYRRFDSHVVFNPLGVP
jgi:hypothetical protein